MEMATEHINKLIQRNSLLIFHPLISTFGTAGLKLRI
jgi:hypothetical protein